MFNMNFKDINFPKMNKKRDEALKATSLILSGWQDSNLRPPAPKAGAMTGLRYTPKFVRRDWDSNPGSTYALTD